ncbi:MAG: hypothetical protein GY826_34025, partial [Fuerstiella sp.]|nr:hypothetical protein [Fuerstiella sp.]
FEAIRAIGRKRRLPVVDLFTALRSEGLPKEHSSNGLHLSPDGHWYAAQAFASQLGFTDRVAPIRMHETAETLLPETAEKLRRAIGQKNDLWFRYWRPTNWAFLYGNRQSTASSRDHTNPSKRWFPVELQIALPGIEEAEQQIQNLSVATTNNESAARPQKIHKSPNGKAYPEHWGAPPLRQTRDLRVLPGGYGRGSGTLAKWIQQNLDRDAGNAKQGNQQ